MKTNTGRILRILALILLAITAVITLLSGIGSTCVAFNPTGWGESMARLAPVAWLYQLLVVITLITALASFWAFWKMWHTQRAWFVWSLVSVAAGLVAGAIQMFTSRALRGSSMPTDIRVYASLLTLIVFLLLLVPGIRQGRESQDHHAGSFAIPGGLGLLMVGIVTLTTPMWVGETHWFDGTNWVQVLEWPLRAGGAVFMLSGILVVVLARKAFQPRSVLKENGCSRDLEQSFGLKLVK